MEVCAFGLRQIFYFRLNGVLDLLVGFSRFLAAGPAEKVCLAPLIHVSLFMILESRDLYHFRGISYLIMMEPLYE
jgi:hypothetical protein